MKYKTLIKHNGIIYGIIPVRYNNNIYPVLLDGNDYLFIKDLKKKFYTDTFGHVYCIHNHKQIEKKIYIHRLVMALHDDKYAKKMKVRIFHNNGINLDNRHSNLTIKETKKSKSRIVKLTDSNVTTKMLPPYVSYMKPNKTHGARFMVKFSTINWKSNSSVKLSLKFKLEQTKKFLRSILTNTNLANIYYKKNHELLTEESIKSYYAIIKKAGYHHIKRDSSDKIKNSHRILKYNASGLTNEEKTLLKNFIPNINKYCKNIVSSIISENQYASTADKETINPIIP